MITIGALIVLPIRAAFLWLVAYLATLVLAVVVVLNYVPTIGSLVAAVPPIAVKVR